MKKNVLGILIVTNMLFTFEAISDDLGFGKVDGIKHYDFSSNKSIVIIMDTKSSRTKPDCLVSGRINGKISYNKHDSYAISNMLSMAMAAQMSGRKIRLYSESSNGCEVDFISIQDSYF